MCHERHRLGRPGGGVYGSSISALAEAGIAQIMIDASARCATLHPSRRRKCRARPL